MTGRIIKKEVLANLQTFRFGAGTAILLLLVLLFGSILLTDYGQRRDEYERAVAKSEAELRQIMVYKMLEPSIHKAPELLALFSQGIHENVQTALRISVNDVPTLENAKSVRNPLLASFPAMDLALVFKLIASLLTFLLTFDAIAGEKEEGTLRLLLSNPLPRSRFILGKFLGGLLTLAIPVALAFLTMSVMLVLRPGIDIRPTDWGRIAMMALASLLFVATLLAIGLFVSALTRRSSDALIILLSTWVIIFLIIPGAASNLASFIKPAESLAKVTATIGEREAKLKTDELETVRRLWLEPPTGYEGQHDKFPPFRGARPATSYMAFATASVLKLFKQAYTAVLPLRLDYAREVGEIHDRYLRDLVVQRRLADRLMMFSPVSLYDRAMSSLARTDLRALEDFRNQAILYRLQVLDYLGKKKAFSSSRYFSVLADDELFIAKDKEDFRRLLHQYLAKPPEPLDTSDFPRFRFENAKEEPPRTSLADFAWLALIGLLFYGCAYAAIVRSDVR